MVPSGESSAPAFPRIVAFLFFFSGAASLIFETVLNRLFTYTFGNTAQAVSTVLAAFLGGLALGAFLLGRWVDRRSASLWTYGVLELLVGFYCLFIPRFFALLTGAYVALYHHLHLGWAGLTAVRFGLAALVIVLPSILMGGTLPVLARYVAAKRSDFGPEVGRLYAWNTWGAALGTLGSTYLLMPSVGLRGTIWFACGIDFAIFLVVAAMAQVPRSFQAPGGSSPTARPSHPEATKSRGLASFLLLGAFLTGAVSLAYEVIWTHVLAFLVGNTVYAFGVMLFTFLCGLGLGARMVSIHLRRPSLWAGSLAASQFALGFLILATIPLWNLVPAIFSRGVVGVFLLDVVSVALLLLTRMIYVRWKIHRRPPGTALPRLRVIELGAEILLVLGLATANPSFFLNPGFLWRHEEIFFLASEFARFACTFYLLILPALLLGMSFPILLNLFTRSASRVGMSVGGVYAANTAGAILGSVLTGFSFLPRFGSLMMLRGAATVNIALGLCFALLLMPLARAHKLMLAASASTLVLLFWIGQGDWDARRMSCGSYVYFGPCEPIDRVLYFREDTQGGLTSVVEQGSTRTLLSNAKYEGNNRSGMQVRLSLIPMLFNQGYNRALVIGLGTGNTLRTLSRFPFGHIDAVEIAPHIVEAAREWFEEVNGRVFDRDPRVKLTIADGRNFLLLSRERFDLITIQITSIWISGEADLYNKEFYELCRARLAEHGVLQQWVQLHHMRTQDLLVILNTAAQVFHEVAFFQAGQQGLLIASPSGLEFDYKQMEAFDADPYVRQELRVLGVPSTSSLLGDLVLHGESFQQAISLLPSLSSLPAKFASTDFRPYLEYQTPKGNTYPYSTVLLNMNFMLKLRQPSIVRDFPMRNLPSESERNLVLGYATEHRRDLRGAVAYFRQVRGPAQPRAQAEIARIESGVSQ